MGRAAALPDERDLPAGAADPFMRQERGGRAGDPPAGERRRREGERIRVQPAPAPQQQGRAAPFLGGELEPARRGRRQPPDLADRCGEAAMAGPLLHHREHLLVIAAFGVEQAIGSQPRLGQAGREQVAAPQRPKHLAAFPPRSGETRGERGDEQGRGGFVIGAGRCRRGLVQPPGKTAARQPFVHFRHADRQARPIVAGGTGVLDPAHLFAQGGKARIQKGRRLHATRTHMFVLCSASSPAESSRGLNEPEPGPRSGDMSGFPPPSGVLAPAAPWR